MRSVPVAIAWETLRNGSLILLFALLLANFFPLILLTALHQEASLDSSHPQLLIIHMILTELNVLIFGGGVILAQGSPARLYARPVSTAMIVVCHLLQTVLLTATEIACANIVLNGLFKTDWPVAGPAMFLSIAVGAVQVTMWYAEKSLWVPFIIGAVGGPLGLWFKSRYGPLFEQPTHSWSQVTVIEVLTCLAIVAASVWLGIVAQSRNRRGDFLGSGGSWKWFQWTRPAISHKAPFQTPNDAQSWFEWRQKGWLMPAAAIVAELMGFGLWLVVSRDPVKLLNGVLAGGGMLGVVALVGGVLHGGCGSSDHHLEMSSFLGTKPITSLQLSRVILRTIAGSVAAAWIIWLLTLFTTYGFLRWSDLTPAGTEAEKVIFSWWFLPLTLLGPWIVASMGTSITLMAPSDRTVKTACLLFVVTVFGSAASAILLSPQWSRQLYYISMVLGGVFFLLLVLFLFTAALRARLIEPFTVCSLSAVAFALAVAVGYLARAHSVQSPPVLLFLIGASALVVAAIPAAPLAISVNRTR